MNNTINLQEWEREQEKITESISANPHSVDEVAEFVVSAFGAVPIEQGSELYRELYLPFKSNLVLKEYPILLKTPYPEPLKPEEMRDEVKKAAFLAQSEKRMEEAESVPDSLVHLDFMAYRVPVIRDKSSIGELLLSLERSRQILTISFSILPGYRKYAGNILLDIYRYYGVTESDIYTKSERFLCYAMILQQYSNRGNIS